MGLRLAVIQLIILGILFTNILFTNIYFQTLYESSIAFGIRKALQAEQGKTDMENYIAKLEGEKAGLEKEVRNIFLFIFPFNFLIYI